MANDGKRAPLRLGDILGERIRALGWEKKLREMEVFSRWEEAVGPQVARRASPQRISRGRLTVAVDSPSWAQQLSLLKSELLGRLREVLGEGLVNEIFVVGGRVPPCEEEGPPPPQPALPDPGPPASLEQEASRIGDAELREAFRGALKASCRRRPREAPRPGRDRPRPAP